MGEELLSNKDRLEKLLEKDPTIQGVPPIMQVAKVSAPEQLKVKDTLIYDPLQDEIELYEQISETKEIDGQYYRITVRAMKIESEDILFAIVFTFIGIILIAFAFLFYLNKARSKKLWSPFFSNLEVLKRFSLKSKEPIIFNQSDILEFHELNNELEILTGKIQTDYRNLKQFTEDVSHEIQTPLAIMQARLDTVINDPDINKMQFEKFSAMQEDIQRLKQLNKKLILIAKIENDQFTNTESINVQDVMENCIHNLEELTTATINLKTNEPFTIFMDRSLATVMFNNLLSNGIKHSDAGKDVNVIINQDSVEFKNNGTKALGGPDHIFERFYKESNRKDSTGLGLSIVKKICDYYGFIPAYRFRESEHIFQINFNANTDS